MKSENLAPKFRQVLYCLRVFVFAVMTVILYLWKPTPVSADITLRENVFVPIILSNGKCLDIRNARVIVQIWDCDDSKGSQHWSYEHGRLRNVWNECLEIAAYESTQNGAKVQAAFCNNESNQRWRINGDALQNGDGLCLDVHAPDIDKNGARAQGWECNNTPQQSWHAVGTGRWCPMASDGKNYDCLSWRFQDNEPSGDYIGRLPYCSGSSDRADWIQWGAQSVASSCRVVRAKFGSWNQAIFRITSGYFAGNGFNTLEISCTRRNFRTVVSGFGGDVFKNAVRIVRSEGDLEGSCIYSIIN